MNDFQKAFARAAKTSPILCTFDLYRQLELEEYEHLHLPAATAEKVLEVGLCDWQQSVRGVVKWSDEKSCEATIVIYEPPHSNSTDLIFCAPHGWFKVDEILGPDSLGASYRIKVDRWNRPTLPFVRSEAP